VSLCLVSQRPKHLSTTALANCNSHLILRITNPYDLKHIGESSEGIDSDSERMITSLRVGEALLVGEAVNYPVFFKVRKNYSADSKHEKTLEEAAKEFEQQKETIEKETEEFL
ncbi:ATP-binding protein, partial [Candidatus Micrarchaeota archaeon]|nr:ATP-binding protein [Candidatus Micrarchaeota archaeon]MBU1930794.1 ATP-binding protein [Candidatus Micrarchaeota archaeon]